MLNSQSKHHQLRVITGALACTIVFTPATVDCKTEPTARFSPETKFGIETFKSLAEGKPSENIFISPISLHACLLLASNGASGSTADEMKHVLGFDTKTVSQMNEYERDLLDQLRSTNKSKPDSEVPPESSTNSNADFTLRLANSIWVDNKLKLNPSFVDKSKETFKAEVRPINFSDQKFATTTINDWVKQNTDGKISEIVDSLSSDQRYMLLNAAYFKADWQNEFNKANTTDGDFHVVKGTDKKVQMMQMTRSFGYLENKSFQAIELPYKDPDTCMLVFLPRGKTQLANLVQRVTPSDWQGWMKDMDMHTGTLKLPRFSVSYGASCKQTLTKQGIKKAFTAEADFSGLMSPPSVGISEVLHKTFVKVDEKGTEAAAATSATDRSLGMANRPGSKPFTMIVDHPFLIAVWNKKTRTILFIGQIADPSET